MIRAKMKLAAVVGTSFGGVKAIFHCQYDASREDDKAFQKATPSGQAEFQIDNPAVMGQLVIGRDYYFDIIPVE